MLSCVGCVLTQPAAPARPNHALRDYFARDVEPIVTYRCAGCHAERGCCSKFLAARPDMYTNLKSWPRLIGPSPNRSLFYTKGSHEGPGFPREEAKVIAEWIRAEARQSLAAK